MSRRLPNPSADRAAQNQQTLKTLVKVESNKSCADCKRNKHPRWASWNLGIFVCIRCSGIHRGMGTHISRVKSVDLDAWTDEQLQNMLRWGNARANRYWEAKLAPGHVPAEAKIENFIRTKYDSKRWVMEGGMPDPATLGAGADDELPLNVVQEKAKMERSASLRTASAPSQAVPQPARKPNPDIDLFGDDIPAAAPPPRATPKYDPPPPDTQAAAAIRPAPPQQRQARNGGDSLLGFDFFGGNTASGVPARPSSAAASISSSSGPSRPDLKQSILSLYARSPTPSQSSTQAAPSQADSHSRGQASSQSGSMGGLSNDLSSLSFSAAPSAKSPQPNPSNAFPSLKSSTADHASPIQPVKSPSTQGFGGGSFFDPKPNKPAPSVITASQARPERARGLSSSSGFGDFETAASPPLGASSIQPTASADMFNFSAPSPQVSKPPISPPISQSMNSPFNLSASKPSSSAKPATQPLQQSNHSGLLNMDAWGSNDAWASPAPSAPPPTSNTKAPATLSSPSADWGSTDWGGGTTSSNGFASTAPKPAARIAPEEDFGGWESSAFAAPAPPPQTSTSKPQPSPSKSSGGFAANDNDLFSNVWE